MLIKLKKQVIKGMIVMELDERKVRILKAIVSNYLETGEPVGSRTISKLADMNVSPATIRNEMSDLEEMGYICQPHASAGRVPTDAGYRFCSMLPVTNRILFDKYIFRLRLSVYCSSR